MLRQWSLPNYFASKAQKISLRYIKNSSWRMRQISRKMEMIHPTIGTHTDRGFSDLYHVFARKLNNALSVLHYVMVALHYSMLHRFEIFSVAGTIAHGSIRLPPRSLASSRGCSLAIKNTKVGDCRRSGPTDRHRRKTAVNSLQRLQSPPNSALVKHDSSVFHSWSFFKTHLHRQRIKGRQSMQSFLSEAIDGTSAWTPRYQNGWKKLKLLTLGLSDKALPV